MYITIKRLFGENKTSSMLEDPTTSNCDSTNPGQPVVKQEKVSGVIHLDLFDENYIDWLKCEPRIKVEQSLIVKTEELCEAKIDQDATKNEVIQDVRSLSEHSPSCQLRIALENARVDQSPDKVMQCCADDMTLDVAMITPNEDLVLTNTMRDVCDIPGLERPLVHTLPVATDELSALNVATSGQDYQVDTVDHDTLLSVATSNQPSSNVIGNHALNVATEMIINTEPLHVPTPSIKKMGDPVCHSEKDVIKAAMCTSPPHAWKYQDHNIEPLTVATPMIDASDPTDKSEINTDIAQIYQVASADSLL